MNNHAMLTNSICKYSIPQNISTYSSIYNILFLLCMNKQKVCLLLKMIMYFYLEAQVTLKPASGPTWSPASSSGAPSTGKTWTCWRGSRGGPQKSAEGWSTSPVRTGWETWGCSARRREGCRADLTGAFQYLKRAYKKDGNKLISRIGQGVIVLN